MYISALVLQHRCVAIFKDKQNKPTGFALGSIEGRVAIHYINPPNPWVSKTIHLWGVNECLKSCCRCFFNSVKHVWLLFCLHNFKDAALTVKGLKQSMTWMCSLIPFRAKDNFTFKCHRSNGTNTTTPQDIYAVSCSELLKLLTLWKKCILCSCFVVKSCDAKCYNKLRLHPKYLELLVPGTTLQVTKTRGFLQLVVVCVSTAV